MISATPHNYENKADQPVDCSFGNVLFTLAGVIGTAIKNGYSFGFSKWVNQEFFSNPLPRADVSQLKPYALNQNYKGFDVGFHGFDIPDNRMISGYFGSWKYFEHCEDSIRMYFTMKQLCNPIKDTIMVHYRDYKGNPNMSALGRQYYEKAISMFPDRRVIVVTDNIEKAFKVLGDNYEYTSNTPILDFYLLTQADYLVMSNSTFSWWGAWLSRAKTVAPLDWYQGEFKDCPTKDLYYKGWNLI